MYPQVRRVAEIRAEGSSVSNAKSHLPNFWNFVVVVVFQARPVTSYIVSASPASKAVLIVPVAGGEAADVLAEYSVFAVWSADA